MKRIYYGNKYSKLIMMYLMGLIFFIIGGYLVFKGIDVNLAIIFFLLPTALLLPKRPQKIIIDDMEILVYKGILFRKFEFDWDKITSVAIGLVMIEERFSSRKSTSIVLRHGKVEYYVEIEDMIERGSLMEDFKHMCSVNNISFRESLELQN